MTEGILREGHNCSTIRHVDRLAMLVDGDEYYRAFFNTVTKAKTNIEILGWEVDSRINIGHINQQYPSNLRQYFNQLVKKNRTLHVNVLSWRSPFYLLFGRENFATAKWRLETDKNIHFQQLGHSHIYGTHHEKIVIVDDQCAFLGGMDISRKRWDTPDHKLENPLRKDEHGHPYHPIHDIQAVLTGEMVQDLKNHLNEKKKQKIIPVENRPDIWPETRAFQVRNVKAALSRTNCGKKTREIENLYLDAIHAAKQFIYIENQYFSSDMITSALCHQLSKVHGPEVIIVLPYSYRGKFEKAVYLNERNKALRKLKAADRYQRLGFFYPDNGQKDKSRFIVVHSKFMIVDNEFMTLGSANLNHRSLNVDSELNLSLEARGEEETKKFIRQNLYRLLSEHLDTPAMELRAYQGSFLATIRAFKGKRERTFGDITSTEENFSESLMTLLTPMVDIRYALPKVHVIIFIFTVLLMSLMFFQEQG